MIHVGNLAFGYGDNGFVLRVDDLAVAEGERVALTGPSGCGKTTLLNLLAGILVPSSGTVAVGDVCVSGLAKCDRQDFRILRIGLVFQEFELLEYIDLIDNVLLPYRISPVLAFGDDVRDRALTLLETVGLRDKASRYPGSLSQGERQRVAVCRALVTEPGILLGDEPTGNLDSENRDLVVESMFAYAATARSPLVVVTHDRELAERFDRTIDVRELA